MVELPSIGGMRPRSGRSAQQRVTPLSNATVQSQFNAQREFYRQQYAERRQALVERRRAAAMRQAAERRESAKDRRGSGLLQGADRQSGKKEESTKAEVSTSAEKSGGVVDELGQPAGLMAVPKVSEEKRQALVASKKQEQENLKKSQPNILETAINKSDDIIRKLFNVDVYEKLPDKYKQNPAVKPPKFLLDDSPTETLLTAGTSAIGGVGVGAGLKLVVQGGGKIATTIKTSADAGSKLASVANKGINIATKPIGEKVIQKTENILAGSKSKQLGVLSKTRKKVGEGVGNIARSATTPINLPLNIMGITYTGDVAERVRAKDEKGNDPSLELMASRLAEIGVSEVIPFSIGLQLGTKGGIKLVDRIATRGKKYIDIRDIGYESGIPLNQKQSPKTIAQSFQKNTYIPPVERFSTFGGVSSAKKGQTLTGPKQARLPTQTKDGLIVWHATPNRYPFLKKEIIIGGSESELAGLYTAPGATGYYAKAGTGKSDSLSIISSDNLLRVSSPGIVSADVLKINIVPKKIRNDWKRINEEFTDPNTLTVPLMKAEYEGVIPPGSRYTFEKSDYYTVIEGRRVPIIEIKSNKNGEIDVVQSKKSLDGEKGTKSSKKKQNKKGNARNISFVSGSSGYPITPERVGIINPYSGISGLPSKITLGSSGGKTGGSSGGKTGGSSGGKTGGSSGGKTGGSSGGKRPWYEEDKKIRRDVIKIKTRKPYTRKETVNQLPWLEVDKVPPAKPIRLYR